MRPLEINWLFAPDGGAASLVPKGYAAFARHVEKDAAAGPRGVLDASSAGVEISVSAATTSVSFVWCGTPGAALASTP